MKMLMIVCPEPRQEEVRALIARHDVHSYSEIPRVLGAGKTGKHRRLRRQEGRTRPGAEGIP